MTNRMKILIPLLIGAMGLTACSAEKEPEETSATTVETVPTSATMPDGSELPEGFTYERAESIDIAMDCGKYLLEYLKMGGLSEEEILAIDSRLTKTAENTYEYDAEGYDKLCYKKVPEDNATQYTRMFSVNTDNIGNWINSEVAGLDAVYGVEHEREVTDTCIYHFNWKGFDEGCTLEVYSTGAVGSYGVIVNYWRKGATTYDDYQEEVIEGAEEITETSEVTE